MEENTEQPLFTIALVVREFPHLTSFSLDSIIRQTFKSYEIVIVEVGLTEHMMHVIESYKEHGVQIHAEEDGNMAHLMNRTVEFAKGKYIHFFYPGDQYLSKNSLQQIADELKAGDPDLFYFSQLERGEEMPYALSYEITKKLLNHGKMPTRMHSCLFPRRIFEELGKFDTRYQYRAGFDMVCRIYLRSPSNIVHKKRVYVDYEYRKIPSYIIFRYAIETFLLLIKYFGIYRATIWWFIQDHFQLTKWLLRSLRQIFWRA